jgi:hypothetical protein
MNRLAQALVCLTDSVAKAAYDENLTPATHHPPTPPVRTRDTASPAFVVVAEPLFDDEVFSDDEAAVPPSDPTEMTQILEMPFEPGLPAATYEVLEWDASPEAALDLPAYEVVPPPQSAPLELPPDEPPATRRELYSRLALVRKMLRVWEKLRPTLADPKHPLDRPAAVLALLDALSEVRPLVDRLRGIVGAPGAPGGIIVALAAQPVILDTFRVLLPSQRQAVAIDWRRGQLALQQEYTQLRRLSRAGRGQSRAPGAAAALWHWLSRKPEVVLVALGFLALFLAMARSTGMR